MAGLHFPITADNSNFMTAIHEVTTSVRDASRQIEADGGNIDKVISRIKTGLVSIGAGWGFKEIAGAVANTRGEFQQLDVAFKTMLGSEEKAATLMSQLVRTAAITPFDLQGVANGAKQLLAYGVSADEVNKRLTQLGDIASGLSIPLNDLVYLYGTTITQGKMFTQDLRQFQGRGIPIADELAKQFGVAKEKVGELVTAGKVGSKEFIAAIDAMTGPGSKFGGLMEEQSKTITGQISNIEDAFDTMLNEIGKSQQGLITGTLDVTSTLIENWQTVLAVLGDIAAAYGVQKAMLALDAGFTKAATNYSYDAEIDQLKTLIPLKEEEQKTALQQAVASGNLTEAKAAEVKTLREEAEAQLATLTAKETAVKAEAAAAASKLESINDEILGIKNLKESLLEQYTAATNAGDAEKAQAIATDIATAETWLKEEASLAATAAEEAKTAATNAAVASEARETLATQINTAQTSGNAAATGILTIAKEKLAIAIGKVNAALKANQFALITGAVIALGYAVYKLVTYQTEAEKIADAHKRTTQNLELELEKENERLEDLNNTLKTSKKGSKDWKEAKDELVSQYGKYLNGIDSEIEKVGYLSDSYKKLTEAVQQSVAARQIAKFQEDNAPNHDELIKSITEKLSGEVILSDPTRDKNGDIVGNNFRKVKIDKKTQKQWIKALIKNLYQGDDSGMTSMLKDFLRNNKSGVFSMDSFGTEVFNARKTQDEYDKYLKNLKDIYGYKDSSSTTDSNKSETKDKEYWENKKKDAESRLEALDSIAAKGKEGAKIKEEIKQYEKEIEAYSTKTKKSSGPTADQIKSKQTEAHQKLIDLMKQQAEERLRLQQDYEYQQWQNRIDLMDEGEAKIIAQMELDHKKEQTSLEEQKKQAIQAEIARQKALFDAREDEKAAGNKKYAKQIFDPGEDVEKTVSALIRIEEEIDAAKNELQNLSGSDNADINEKEYRKKIDSLISEHKKLSDSLGNVSKQEIAKILKNYKSLYQDLADLQDKSYNDRINKAKESLNEYLKTYGSYQQRIEAITKEYADKIAKAMPEERPMLEARRDSEISNIEFDQWKESGLISKAFGDIRKLSSSTVKELIAYMEKYRKKVIDTFDPVKIREFEKALKDLQDLDIDNSLGVFANFVPEPFKEAAKYEKEMVEHEKKMGALIDKRNQIQREILDHKSKILALGKEQGVDIKLDDIADSNAFDNVAKLFEDAGKKMGSSLSGELSSLTGSFGQLGGISDIMGQMGGMMGGGAGGAMNTMDAVGTVVHLVNDSVQSLKELFDDLMETADLLGADTEVGSNWAQASLIMDGFAEASEGASNAFDSLKSGNPVGVIQGVVQSFTGWIKAFAKFKDAKHERTIIELQERIDALQKSYDKLGKAADKAYSTDASGLIDQQNTLLKQQKVLIKQQMAEEQAKKKTDKEKIKEYQEQLEEIDELLEENADKAKEAIIGEDIKSAISDFVSLYAEAWDDGTDAAQKSMQAVKSIISSALTELLKKNIQPAAQNFYDTLAKAMEDGILTDAELANLDAIKARMDALAAAGEEQYKKIQERYKDLDELREELTDISFDSVRDNFKSLLSDMESSTADFTESFTDMLRNALIEGLMDSKYDALLKEWYAEFAEAMDDHKLTDEERERLRQQYQSIIDQGIADRNAINAIVGGGAYSQQASSGEAWGMTQETGEELNGRFTAMVELEATNNVLVSDGNAIAREILVTLRSMSGLSMTVTGNGDNETLLAIKDMIFLSTGYLEDIAKYSKLLAVISSDVADMKEKVKDI